jgi:acetylornithine/succinyldiaminopimelate/putrescine aminotransferase
MEVIMTSQDVFHQYFFPFTEGLRYVEEVCKENVILFLVDEAQTGIGRTVTLLCSEQYHILPNILTLAKGLGGGLPMGAVLMDEAVISMRSYSGGRPEAAAMKKITPDHISKNKKGLICFLKSAPFCEKKYSYNRVQSI